MWQANVATRAIDKQGCPYCSGRKVLPEDSIIALFPEVAAEFHPTKNGEARPEQFAPNSNKHVWWQCRIDSTHKWKSEVANRTKGSQCPQCRKLENSLARKSPQLAAEWHPKWSQAAVKRRFGGNAGFTLTTYGTLALQPAQGETESAPAAEKLAVKSTREPTENSRPAEALMRPRTIY
ncbi:hypothetical protein RMSM_03768 [Rhodopirellula maiorica SM1]|uniref:Treble clef zinc finger domain-containing protein n=1 Tax=Rhodopirellula maiorica SM1 TaxID=1265738 RepID=M5RJ52_9BACT|nr:hypothetical protein RMSM_03768 [Rhodopirellula maiorica SM1]